MHKKLIIRKALELCRKSNNFMMQQLEANNCYIWYHYKQFTVFQKLVCFFRYITDITASIIGIQTRGLTATQFIVAKLTLHWTWSTLYSIHHQNENQESGNPDRAKQVKESPEMKKPSLQKVTWRTSIFYMIIEIRLVCTDIEGKANEWAVTLKNKW